MKYFLESYGCEMNTAEAFAMKSVLKEAGWEEAREAEEARLVIINTCSVRKGAETRVWGRLAHFFALKKKCKTHRLFILITGCMARLEDDLKRGGADFVLSVNERDKFGAILGDITRDAAAALPPAHDDAAAPPPVHDERYEFAPLHYEEGLPRALIPIMNGCDNFCSYCIVPYTRGREVSRAPESIKNEIHHLAEKGVREITLLGQNVNSYLYKENENEITFPKLLRNIAGFVKDTPVKRVRFLSSHPKNFSNETIDVLKTEPVFCPHIHLCVQHGSNKILKAMNRHYTRERYIEIVNATRAAIPEITISTDILTGFPGETEDDFSELLSLMREVKFSYAFMYHYNPRKGTAAYNLPNRIEDGVKKERLARIIALQKEITKEILRSRVGESDEVLVEGISKKNSAAFLCRTGRDEMAVVEGDGIRVGDLFSVSFERLSGNTLIGRRCDRGGEGSLK